MSEWQPIETCPPYETVMLYRLTDLYPVVGSKVSDHEGLFTLEEGGPEDGEHRRYPFLRYAPTHWKRLDETPMVLCADCDIYPADLPSKLCPGCQAYRDHTGQI